jgi:hypothetical protein
MARRDLALTLALTATFLAGCATWRAEPGATHTLKRHLNAWQTTVALPIEEVHKATLAGLDDLGLRPVSRRVDKLTGMADGLLADGTDFEVHLEAQGETVTKVRVRCGMFGDRARSAQIFRAIEKHF